MQVRVCGINTAEGAPIICYVTLTPQQISRLDCRAPMLPYKGCTTDESGDLLDTRSLVQAPAIH